MEDRRFFAFFFFRCCCFFTSAVAAAPAAALPFFLLPGFLLSPLAFAPSRRPRAASWRLRSAIGELVTFR